MASASQTLTQEWLRALRGRRSQQAFSRWLGYRSNVAYRWEAGHSVPNAARHLEILERSGVDIEAGLQHFFRRDFEGSGAARGGQLDAPRVVAGILSALRGQASLVELVRRSGYTRFALARWFKGTAMPSLPELLDLIEVLSLRRLDFIAAFTDPARLPSAAGQWTLLEQTRRLAYEEPWTQAVPRALELSAYRAQPRHDAQWLARQLGVDVALVERCLRLLVKTRQIELEGAHYVPRTTQMVDTRTDPRAAQRMKAWWATLALQRLERGEPGVYSYNVSAVSRRDLSRMQELQRPYYRELAQIIEGSNDPECVVLFNAQLLALSDSGRQEPVPAIDGANSLP